MPAASKFDYQLLILHLAAAGLMSRRTAIEKLGLVKDAEKEYRLIQDERMSDVTGK